MSENGNPYDLMILGAGPAGITAALYGQRLGLKTIVFGDIPGGSSYMIEHLANFPGLMEGTSGTQFGTMAFQQAQKEGAHFTLTRLESFGHNDNIFIGCRCRQSRAYGSKRHCCYREGAQKISGFQPQYERYSFLFDLRWPFIQREKSHIGGCRQ